MIKAYGLQDRKAYYIFEKSEVTSAKKAIEQVSKLAKENKALFKSSFAEKDSDGNFSVELPAGKYICVNKK